MADEISRAAIAKRRARNIGGLVVLTALLTVLLVPIILLTLIADLVLLRFRLPVTRLVVFALCWSWLETAGVLTSAGLWVIGRGRDVEAHYRLQRWWAGRLLASLRSTCGLELNVEGVEALSPGPVVLLVRHASLADSLVTAWVVTELGGLRPRFVLKDELLADPCLDIVGNRLANCFIDRSAADAEPALAAIAKLGAGMTPSDAAIIFPEGTRSNDAKRLRALERIAAHDEERAERLAELRHLLPPRPSGTRALIDSASGAHVVLGCHVGFERMDTFANIIAKLARQRITIRFRLTRVSVPSTGQLDFDRWLDDTWLDLDRQVDKLLQEQGLTRPAARP